MLNFFKRRAATQGDDLRYEDIPCKQDRAVEAETYPQKSRPIPALPMHDIVDRYSGLLRSILDNLPLTSEEINRLIMPVVSRLIRLVHLLPASEAQHHSGCGGLLVHSLESAAIGLLYASNEVFDQGRTPEHRYRNQPRWICAAAVLLLIHDVGKVCDVVVTDSDGNLWNPEAQPLLDWLVSTGAKQFFVDWKPEREHKEHERRSVRFAYRYLLTDDLVHYLTAVSDGELLNAIDDALMLGSGTLSGILKLADGRSVAQDNARRKRISGDFTYVSSPLVNPIIEAMRQNIASGRWQVNTSGGAVFVSPQGVFIRAEQDMGRSIRETAVSQGFSSIPVAIDRIANVLADAGFVEVFETHLAQTYAQSHRHECPQKFTVLSRIARWRRQHIITTHLLIIHDDAVAHFPDEIVSSFTTEPLLQDATDAERCVLLLEEASCALQLSPELHKTFLGVLKIHHNGCHFSLFTFHFLNDTHDIVTLMTHLLHFAVATRFCLHDETLLLPVLQHLAHLIA